MDFEITEYLNDRRIIDFLLKDNRATIYHHPAWLKAIQNSFKYKAKYLVGKDSNNHISGLLPFIEFNNKISPKKIISFPMSNYCDPLFSDHKLPEAIEFLKNNYPTFQTIDLRTSKKFDKVLPQFSFTEEYVTHILKLRDTLDETFNSFHPTSVRASIRRAEKNNLEIKWGNSPADLNIFYHLEFKLRKRLLLPPIPYHFFKNIWTELIKENLISLPIVYKNGFPVAAGFILNFKDTYYLEYTASDKNYINLYPNHKLFYEVIKKAHLTGAKKVDFGRTSNDNQSLITFKEKWAAEKFPLYHHVYPGKANNEKNKDSLRKYLMKINYYLPDFVLELEGKFIYRLFL
ncbi:Hypothetical protein IALB_2456 [Ignavibacterium album JCM 16511]|uniref:BioF2-like acetyltransferase domain-containing protein n=1 Tax=Ignavibacterium album (strain DSM 19864 / JCM 16511 / NBRC 101810 / Mat9-16) TaxID=945713 RepID=I0AMF2_IGNAJ|nr:GNAT family N-acetyltransferase [Ignavibacterium album]AFH50159.1 Hypothetical protein IALB_2456 [Ignavibacterium album JCM 16511]